MSDAKPLDLGLQFLHRAFELKSLHFGLFADGVPRSIVGLREAQSEYTRVLVGLVPEGAKSVLDVGSGLGDTSKALEQAGFSVEGLSPDPYHGEQFRLTCGPEMPFHLSRFEAFEAAKTYDCLLFGESPAYIDKEAFFPKCLDLTKEGSHLVAADFFRIAPGSDYPNSFAESDFVAKAERAGFKVAFRRDVTAEVLPNFELIRRFLDYGQRLFDIARDAARCRAPVLWKVVRLFFGRKLRRLDRILNEKLPAQFDEERFRRTMRYVMFRLTR